jgi:hypothetical protein
MNQITGDGQDGTFAADIAKRSPRETCGHGRSALMLSVSSPLARRASDDGCEGAAESRLIGEPRLKGHFRQRTSGVYEERLRPFDALQDEVAVRRRSKRLPERFREMAHGQATFTRQGREAERGHSEPGTLLPARDGAVNGSWPCGAGTGGDRQPASARVARKCPRTAQRARARHGLRGTSAPSVGTLWRPGERAGR